MTDKNPSSLRSALMMQNPDHVNIIVQFAYESIYYKTKVNQPWPRDYIHVCTTSSSTAQSAQIVRGSIT